MVLYKSTTTIAPPKTNANYSGPYISQLWPAGDGDTSAGLAAQLQLRPNARAAAGSLRLSHCYFTAMLWKQGFGMHHGRGQPS